MRWDTESYEHAGILGHTQQQSVWTGGLGVALSQGYECKGSLGAEETSF